MHPDDKVSWALLTMAYILGFVGVWSIIRILTNVQ